MPVSPARMSCLSSRPLRAGYSIGLAALVVVIGCNSLQNATAEGDTRTLSFHHTHTGEDLTITYKVNGRYDEEALKQINHELRDWRKDETIAIDPHLIDLVWEVRREFDSNEPIWVVCGYRSPATNAMLRRRSHGVAKFSQHMLGKAMDFYIPGAPLDKLREAGLRAQRGGVGFYPSSNFVHLDTGSVRHWPRMPEPELARVIAKGPLRASSGDRETKVASALRIPGPLVKLLGGGDEEYGQGAAAAAAPKTAAAVRAESARPAAKQTRAAALVPIPPVKPANKPASRPETANSGFELASASSTPVQMSSVHRLVRSATNTATDVISTRGFWQGQADNIKLAAADPAAAGGLAPWPTSSHESNGRMLAYAPTSTAVSSPRASPMGTGITREVPPPATTVATKRSGNRPTIVASPPAPIGPTKQGPNDPWMRAMIVSPSAEGFMSTSQLGAPDYRTLSPYLQKPAVSVMMTFCDDPYLGMSTDKFNGIAVVFMSTVTFYQRTASLH